MSWLDRVKPASLVSPSRIEIGFDFEDVAIEFEKKTSPFEFVDADGTYIQSSGFTGDRIPLRIYFSGPDYDLEAKAFNDILKEEGVFKLKHPIYGEKNVVPFGKIARRDDLKTAANQAIFSITFWETTGLVYPTPQVDAASEVLGALDKFTAAGAEKMAEASSLATAGERATFKGQVLNLFGQAKSGLQFIADTTDSVSVAFESIASSINDGIDVLIAEPLALAFQISELIKTPGRALASIQARLDGYKNLAESIIKRPDGSPAILTPDSTPDPVVNPAKVPNELLIADLYASNYLAGSIVSVVNTQFETKTDALAAAVAVLTQLDELTTWRDDNFEALESIDTGESYQQILAATTLAAGLLVEISFSLKQERSVILDRDRTVIDLSAELYGSVSDENIDFLIVSNMLTGDEILELPRGREIVYYV